VIMRTGNRALTYLLAKHQPFDAKTQKAADSIAAIAKDFLFLANESAKPLVQPHTEGFFQKLLKRGAMTKALAQSIMDLQLTVAFNEFQNFVGDAAIASLLTDAVLFEAIGQEATSPTETDMLVGSTKDVRGIHKFMLAYKKYPHIGDTDAWAFGKEYAHIVSGCALDIAHIASVASVTISIRVHAKWAMRLVLAGTPPTDEERKNLDKLMKDGAARMEATIAKLGQS